MTDLLDLLADLEPTAKTVHVLMPCMVFACGRDMIHDGGRFQVGINDWSAIDCHGCRSLGQDDLRAEMSRQQSTQAGAA